jgi:CheY-like chemotaxis protein
MYRILVVDDDPAVLSCYGRLLQRAGHAVETAHGGSAALARLSAAAAFDVVIIDYRMPEMDGMEFLRQMRRAGHAPEVILVSAYVTDKVRESAVRMGVRRILEKPVDIDKLRAAIREAIPMPRSAGTGC